MVNRPFWIMTRAVMIAFLLSEPIMAGEAGIKDMGIMPQNTLLTDTIRFTTPFVSTPVVVCCIEDSSRDPTYEDFIMLRVRNVTIDGFIIHIGNCIDDSAHVWVHWIALDADTNRIHSRKGDRHSNTLLLQNRPNPTAGVSYIKYQIPKGSYVSLKIYNNSGRHIKTLVESRQEAGEYNLIWNRRDDRGQMVPIGAYYYILEVDGRAVTKKAIVLK